MSLGVSMTMDSRRKLFAFWHRRTQRRLRRILRDRLLFVLPALVFLLCIAWLALELDASPEQVTVHGRAYSLATVGNQTTMVPIEGAVVSVGSAQAVTSADGRFTLSLPWQPSVVVAAQWGPLDGHRRIAMDPTVPSMEVDLVVD
jgi:hypothetical protein